MGGPAPKFTQPDDPGVDQGHTKPPYVSKEWMAREVQSHYEDEDENIQTLKGWIIIGLIALICLIGAWWVFTH